MSDLSKDLAPGLLVLALALSGFLTACGNDDEPSRGGGEDACACGDSGGGGGRSGAGSGGEGSGGRDGGGGPGGSDAGSTVVSETECLEATDASAHGTVSDDCAACLCRESAADTAACTADCWALRVCFARRCPGFTQGTDAGSTCAVARCMELLGGAIYATPVDRIIASQCSDVCAITEADGGTDDGGR